MIVDYIAWEGGREGEREREGGGGADRQRDRDRQTDRQTDRERQRQRDSDRLTHRQRKRQRDRKRKRRKGRGRERQRHRETETELELENVSNTRIDKSIWTYFTANLCCSIKTKHDYTINTYISTNKQYIDAVTQSSYKYAETSELNFVHGHST